MREFIVLLKADKLNMNYFFLSTRGMQEEEVFINSTTVNSYFIALKRNIKFILFKNVSNIYIFYAVYWTAGQHTTHDDDECDRSILLPSARTRLPISLQFKLCTHFTEKLEIESLHVFLALVDNCH